MSNSTDVCCGFMDCFTAVCWTHVPADSRSETSVQAIDREKTTHAASADNIRSFSSRWTEDGNDKSMNDYWLAKLKEAAATEEATKLWQIYRQLQIVLLYMSKGSFGVVYGIPQSSLALKVVKTNVHSPRPKNEKAMLEYIAMRQTLGGLVCAPCYYGCGEHVDSENQKSYAFFFDREDWDLETACKHTTYERKLKACVLVLTVVKNLHAIGVIHRDIKLKNMLCNKKMTRVLLCDFGGACKMGSVDRTQQFTLGLCSPEMLYRRADFQPTAANDVWATGVALCQIFSSYAPWGRPTDTKKGSSIRAAQRIAEVLGDPKNHRTELGVYSDNSNVRPKLKSIWLESYPKEGTGILKHLVEVGIPPRVGQILAQFFVYDGKKRITITQALKEFSALALSPVPKSAYKAKNLSDSRSMKSASRK